MGVIRELATKSETIVRGTISIGRALSCDVRLASPGVSSQHAAIQWTGASWTIRDLGSRNGTLVNKHRLSNASFPLAPGDEIVFGDPQERWLWVDGSAPAPCAVTVDGTLLEANAGMLFLPSENSPTATVFLRDEEWMLELGGEVQAVHDGQQIDVGGELFRLQLPSLAPTVDRTQTVFPETSIVDARVSFFVSMDEEHVRIFLESAGRTREVAGRAFHYMLLLLARQRRQDALAGIAAADAGWMYTDELAAALAIDPTILNVHVCRARKAAQFQQRKDESDEAARLRKAKEPEFRDPYELLQRRTGQMRLGVANITIDRDESDLDTTP